MITQIYLKRDFAYFVTIVDAWMVWVVNLNRQETGLDFAPSIGLAAELMAIITRPFFADIEVFFCHLAFIAFFQFKASQV